MSISSIIGDAWRYKGKKNTMNKREDRRLKSVFQCNYSISFFNMLRNLVINNLFDQHTLLSKP